MEYNINPLEDKSWTLPAKMSGTTNFVSDIIKPECANFTQEHKGRINVSQKVNPIISCKIKHIIDFC